MNKLIVIPILAIILMILDLYTFSALKVFFKGELERWLKSFTWVYILISVFGLIGLFNYHFGDKNIFGHGFRSIFMSFLFITYFSKGLVTVILLIGDSISGIRGILGKWFSLGNKMAKNVESDGHQELESQSSPKRITRGDFLKKASVITASIPFATLSFGILNGVHNYRIVRRKVGLKNLPASFHGLKIVQLSDIHSGSFFDKKSVLGGIEMVLGEKPDLIFFTGDLVNNETSEVNEYIDIFKKIQAPMGTYSVLGNHDYGNYRPWPSMEAKIQNLKDMHQAHQILGWKLLNNENKIIEQNGEKIAIVGVENWGTGRFPKYGKLEEAIKNTDESAVKLLLSHDPSHWDAEVRKNYPQIDIMFSGHTHGFQFGIEAGNFKWSPSQYLYKQWADLYRSEDQFLYVNRGFGFLGFPGRVGIEPEITVIELVKESDFS